MADEGGKECAAVHPSPRRSRVQEFLHTQRTPATELETRHARPGQGLLRKLLKPASDFHST